MTGIYDELNNQTTKTKAIPYRQYFSEMEALTESQITERVDFAERLGDVVLYIFSLITLMVENDYLDAAYAISVFAERYGELVSGYEGIAQYANAHITLVAAEIIQTTIDNIEDEYYTSYDRVQYISENEANSILNYKDLQDATANGYTKKTWLTMRDRRVRHTHAEVDGRTIDITEPFAVGSSLMMMPKDDSLGAGADEIVNCRCSVKYS